MGIQSLSKWESNPLESPAVTNRPADYQVGEQKQYRVVLDSFVFF